MEPEGSLPHSQVAANYPHPEPARSSPYPPIILPGDPSLCNPSICAWVSQVVSFPQFSPPTLCIRLSSHQYALHAPPISFFSILSPEQYLVSNTVHSAPHYAASSSLLLPRPFEAQIFSSAPYSMCKIYILLR